MGQGFYSATRPDLRYGDVGVRVAVRLRRPLIVTDPLAWDERLDQFLEEMGVDIVRDALHAAGFDGLSRMGAGRSLGDCLR